MPRSLPALLITPLLLLWGTAVAEEFNPYQAVQDGLTVNAAIPIIAKNVGPIAGTRVSGPRLIGENDQGPLMMITADYGGKVPAMFIFCRGSLVAFDTPISATLADQLVAEIGKDPAEEDFEVDGNVRVRLADGKAQINYFNPPGEEPWVDLTYPYRPFMLADFTEQCPE